MEPERWTLIRPQAVWIVRRINTKTKLETVMSVHISRHEAVFHKRNRTEQYCNEKDYKFRIDRRMLQTETIIKL